MRQWVIGIGLALVLGFAPAVNAQYHEDQQNPGEYNEDDSQPLKIASYFVAPIGFALEWTVARPLNYLANQTPLAPALNPERDKFYGPPRMANLPPPDKFAPEPYEANPSEAKTAVIGAPPPPSQVINPAPPPPAHQPAMH
jgi:hypothetical protein